MDRDTALGLDISINMVRLCVWEYHEGGIKSALSDVKRSGHPMEITDGAKAWIIHAACQRPAALSYAKELWMLKISTNIYRDMPRKQGFRIRKPLQRPGWGKS